MKRSLALLLPLVLVACQDAREPLAPNSADSAVPSFSQGQSGDVVPGQYIVVFNDGVADAPGLARRLAQQQGGEAFYTYEHAIKGFAFRGSDQAAAALTRNPNVAYVEQDQVMRVSVEHTLCGRLRTSVRFICFARRFYQSHFSAELQ